MRSRTKVVLFSLAPALLLLIGAEVFVRLALVVRPSLTSLPLPGEGTLLVPDADLFWSLRPSNRERRLGALVVTNDRGMRSPPLRPAEPDEVRILSLGESTTFGSRVALEQTYTWLLGQELDALERASGGSRRFTTLNAGVPAYSSFQSLKYLEYRGLALEPDLVLVYHEVNDYLPSTVRDSSNNEIGMLLTDAQLHARRRSVLNRVAQSSALVRLGQLWLARWQIGRLDARTLETSLPGFAIPEIGLARIDLPARLRRGRDEPAIDEAAVGRRVSEDERREILAEFERLTGTSGSRLVLVHPSYRRTKVHECVLTRFAESRGVLMFDAHDALHPKGSSPGALFLDSWHPGPEGHARLAKGLAAYLWENVFANGPRRAETATLKESR